MMLSSAGRPGEAAQCRELGLAACLTKPIKQSELLDTIMTTLDGKPWAGRAVRAGRRSAAAAAVAPPCASCWRRTTR